MRGVFYFMELYQNFLERFITALLNANRDFSEVELIAASKKKSSDEIKSNKFWSCLWRKSNSRS